MKTNIINQEALSKISKMIPELNQDTDSVNVNVEFYNFTDVYWTIKNLLEVVYDKLQYSSDEPEAIDISVNLIRLAKGLLPMKNADFLDELLTNLRFKNESKLEKIIQK